MSLGASSSFISSVPVVTYSVFITPSPLHEFPKGGGSALSSPALANVTGGTAPFSYLWNKESGDNITINNPTSNSTLFSAGGAIGDELQAIFKVTVTDNLAAVEAAFVTVTFTFII